MTDTKKVILMVGPSGCGDPAPTQHLRLRVHLCDPDAVVPAPRLPRLSHPLLSGGRWPGAADPLRHLLPHRL